MKAYELIWLATVAAAMIFVTAAFSSDSSINMLVRQLDGLHKAALASGGAYQTGRGSAAKYRMNSLNDLVAGSPTIVVASVRSATPVLKDNGRFLFTNYQLNVIEPIKGDFANTDVLEMMGATYTFSLLARAHKNLVLALGRSPQNSAPRSGRSVAAVS